MSDVAVVVSPVEGGAADAAVAGSTTVAAEE